MKQFNENNAVTTNKISFFFGFSLNSIIFDVTRTKFYLNLKLCIKFTVNTQYYDHFRFKNN